jgi:phosphoglycerate kinase
MKVQLMTDVDLRGKKVVLREDLNVPLKNGIITSEARITAALQAIRYGLAQGAAIVVLSHLGRPKEGAYAEEFSLAPVAARLGELLGKPVPLLGDYVDGVDVRPGDVVLCENLRFQPGENANSPELSARLAALGDVYVMDAFATAHRANASTEGAVRLAKTACCGPLMAAELDALSRILERPAKPLLAVIGGSKVSTKLLMLDNLTRRVDRMIVGGGIANTFLAATGHVVGRSLMESDLIPDAKRIMEAAKARGVDIPLPFDVVVASECSPAAPARVCAVDEVGADDMILDVGPETAARFASVIAGAGTIVWNGPVGAFEIDAFGEGTRVVAEAIAAAPGFSVIGGGDSIAASEKYGVADKMDYISTAGGAFLEMLEGRELPAVAALIARA